MSDGEGSGDDGSRPSSCHSSSALCCAVGGGQWLVWWVGGGWRGVAFGVYTVCTRWGGRLTVRCAVRGAWWIWCVVCGGVYCALLPVAGFVRCVLFIMCAVYYSMLCTFRSLPTGHPDHHHPPGDGNDGTDPQCVDSSFDPSLTHRGTHPVNVYSSCGGLRSA